MARLWENARVSLIRGHGHVRIRCVLEEQREETRAIIAELLEDGSDPDAQYTIEHHFSSENYDKLEKRQLKLSNWVMK